MADLKLSSYERMRRYITADGDDTVTSSDWLKMQIDGWIRSVSTKIAKYLIRDIGIEERTEYWDTRNTKREFWVNAPPISEISSVVEDTSAEYNSGTTLSSDQFFTNVDASGVVLDSPVPEAKKALKIVYTGGLAYHGTRSTFTGTYSTTFTAGYYALGQTSDALGFVRTSSGTTLVVEVLRGVFEAGETVAEYDTDGDDVGSATGNTFALTTISQQALIESHPAIVLACEAEVRYLYKHKDDFELIGSNRDATNIRRSENRPGMMLTKEAVNLLMPYRRMQID